MLKLGKSCISVPTVKTHVAHILKKLGVSLASVPCGAHRDCVSAFVL